MITMPKLKKFMIGLIAALVFSGCATTPHPNDPAEGFNRLMFNFNEAIDAVVIKHVALMYSGASPDVAQDMVSNFFGNFRDLWTGVNHLLQGEGDKGMSDISRVMINTFIGLGGLIDVASDAGLPKHRSDFGVTLGVWGVEPGPYLVWPVIGPSTLRDTVALPADWYGNVWIYVGSSDALTYGGLGLRGISDRAALLDAVTTLENISLDKYEFIRDAYLQRRASMVQKSKQSEKDWEDGSAQTTTEKQDASASKIIQIQ